MRVPDWQMRLGEVFKSAANDTFEWGRNDCVLFAARCVEAVTGTHPAMHLIGTYSTESGALAALSAAGYANLAEAFAAFVGPERPVPFAQRGDLVTMGDFVGGVVDLTGEIAIGLDPEQGIVMVPVLTAQHAFAVG